MREILRVSSLYCLLALPAALCWCVMQRLLKGELLPPAYLLEAWGLCWFAFGFLHLCKEYTND
jgi:hypothetical protein